MAAGATGGQSAVPGAIADAATADFAAPIRDLMLNGIVRPIGGQGAADTFSRLGLGTAKTVSPLARILAGLQ